MRNKFFNKTVHHPVYGKFDSQLELDRYLFLLAQEKAGLIRNICRQVQYEIIPRQTVLVRRFGKKGQELSPREKTAEHPAHYTADFVYEAVSETITDGKSVTSKRLVIEDTKSKYTRQEPDYVLRRKLMRLSGNPIVEVLSPTEPIKIHV